MCCVACILEIDDIKGNARAGWYVKEFVFVSVIESMSSTVFYAVIVCEGNIDLVSVSVVKLVEMLFFVDLISRIFILTSRAFHFHSTLELDAISESRFFIARHIL